MTRPDGGVLRGARTGVLAATTVCLAALAHACGGGSLPGPAALLVLGALVGAGSLVASAHRLGTRSLAVLLGGGQLGLHLAFTVLGRTGAPVDPGVGMAIAAHHGHGSVPDLAAAHLHAAGDQSAGAHAALGHVHHGGWVMLLAHVLATAVTALVLARGERALWLLAGLVAPAVRPLPVRPALRPRPALPVLPVLAPALAHVRDVAPRRGPPLLVRPT
ncbi:hypothetical protein [Arsenicicoccus dermatophilus]|uniref:hypothetical protein n=1 Tax=Arsenicicoccus dermatophilus TaxID=1076331 RepID=UPI0039175A13